MTIFVRPNGLAFTPDEASLYIADTRAAHIRVSSVTRDGALVEGRVFAECSEGVFDGIRLDAEGRVWATAGSALHCFAPDGAFDRQAPASRASLEPRLRRPEAESVVHHRVDVGLLVADHRQRGDSAVAAGFGRLNLERVSAGAAHSTRAIS